MHNFIVVFLVGVVKAASGKLEKFSIVVSVVDAVVVIVATAVVVVVAAAISDVVVVLAITS